jgi:hypothetical protein
MSHREEAPRQQLTAPDSSETPRTDASLSDTQIAHLKEGILGRGGWTPFYEDMIGLLCEQASRLSQCREALEEARKAIREIITEDCPMQIIDDPSIVACVKADACGCCWAKHKSAIDAASAPKE